MLKGVPNYLKNVTKSMIFVATDVAKEDLTPNLGRFTEENKEFFSTVYSGIINPKTMTDKVANKVKENKVYQALDYGMKNIFEDLRTGDFYNKARTDKDSMEFSGFGDFFTDDDTYSDIGFNDDGDISSSIDNDDITEGDIKIVGAIEGSNKASTNTTVNAILASSQYQADITKSNTGLLFAQQEKLFGGLHNDIAGMHSTITGLFNLSSATFQNLDKNISSYFTESLKVNQEISAMLKEMLEMQRNQYKSAADKENEQNKNRSKPKKNRWSDINSSGMVSFGDYANLVKNNISNEISSLVPLPDFGEDSNLMAAFMTAPLAGALKYVVNGIIPITVKEATKELDESITGLFGQFIARLANAKNEDRGIFSILSKFLGVKVNPDRNIETGRYEKGPIPFDGLTRKSIIDVIPSYLRRIEAALTGKPEKFFDYDNGKWTTGKEIRDKYDKIKENAIRSGTSDLRYEMSSKFKSVREGARSFEESADLTKAENEFYAFLYKNNGIFNPDKSASDNGIEFYEFPNLYTYYSVVAKIYKDFDKVTDRNVVRHVKNSIRINLARNVLDAKDYENRQYRRLENAPTSATEQFFNAPGVDTHGKWKTEEGTDNKKFEPGFRLLSAKDSTNRSIYDYLQEINKELIWQRKIGFKNINRGGTITPTVDGVPQPNIPEVDYTLDTIRIAKKVSSNSAKHKWEAEQRRDEEIAKRADRKIKSGEALDLRDFTADEQEYLLKLSELLQKGATSDYKTMISDANDANIITKFVDKHLFRPRLNSMSDIELAVQEADDKGISTDKVQLTEEQKEARRQQYEAKIQEEEEKNNPAGSLLNKFKNTAAKIANIAGSPAEIFTNLLYTADQAIYDMMYSNKLLDDEHRSKYKGFMDMMVHKTEDMFSSVAEKINDNILKPLAARFNLGKGDFKERFVGSVKSMFSKAAGDVVSANRDVYGDTVDKIKNKFNSSDHKQKQAEKRKADREEIVKDMAESYEAESLTDENLIKIAAKYDLDASEYDNLEDLVDDIYYYGAESLYSKSNDLTEIDNAIQSSLINYYLTSSEDPALMSKVAAKMGFTYNGKTSEELSKDFYKQFNIARAKQLRPEMAQKISDKSTSRDQLIDYLSYFTNADEFDSAQGNLSDDELKQFLSDKLSEQSKSDSKDKLKEVDRYCKNNGFVGSIAEKQEILKSMGIPEEVVDKLDTDKKLNGKFYIEHKNNNRRPIIQNHAKGTFGKPFKGTTMLSKGELLFNKSGVGLVQKTDAYKLDQPTHILNSPDSHDLLESAGFKDLGPKSTIEKDLVNENKIREDIYKQTGIKSNAKGTININDQEINIDPAKILDELKKYLPETLAGTAAGGLISAVLGLVGGPLVGAAVGAGTALVSHSDAAKDVLFGKLLSDGSREGGIVPKTVTDAIYKYMPNMKKYGLAGIIPGLITPLGPIGGILVGSAIGFLKTNDEFREKIIGENGFIRIDDYTKSIVKDMFPHTAIGAGIGALSSFIVGGPFGILGNAAIGAAIGMMTTTEEFKEGVLGGHKDFKGVLDTIKTAFDPLTNAGNELKDKLFEVVEKNIAEPINAFIIPAIHALPQVAGIIPRMINDFVQDKFGNTVDGIIKDTFLKPFKFVLDKFVTPVAKTALNVVTSPVRLLGVAGNAIRKRQIKTRNADYMYASERNLYRQEHGMEADDFDLQLEKIGTEGGMSVDQAQDMYDMFARATDDIGSINKDIKSSQKAINDKLNNFRTEDGKELRAGTKKKVRKYLQAGDTQAALNELRRATLSDSSRTLSKDELDSLLKGTTGDKDQSLEDSMVDYVDYSNRKKAINNMTDEDKTQAMQDAKAAFAELGLDPSVLNDPHEMKKIMRNLKTDITRVKANEPTPEEAATIETVEINENINTNVGDILEQTKYIGDLLNMIVNDLFQYNYNSTNDTSNITDLNGNPVADFLEKYDNEKLNSVKGILDSREYANASFEERTQKAREVFGQNENGEWEFDNLPEEVRDMFTTEHRGMGHKVLRQVLTNRTHGKIDLRERDNDLVGENGIIRKYKISNQEVAATGGNVDTVYRLAEIKKIDPAYVLDRDAVAVIADTTETKFAQVIKFLKYKYINNAYKARKKQIINKDDLSAIFSIKRPDKSFLAKCYVIVEIGKGPDCNSFKDINKISDKKLQQYISAYNLTLPSDLTALINQTVGSTIKGAAGAAANAASRVVDSVVNPADSVINNINSSDDSSSDTGDNDTPDSEPEPIATNGIGTMVLGAAGSLLGGAEKLAGKAIGKAATGAVKMIGKGIKGVGSLASNAIKGLGSSKDNGAVRSPLESVLPFSSDSHDDKTDDAFQNGVKGEDDKIYVTDPDTMETATLAKDSSGNYEPDTSNATTAAIMKKISLREKAEEKLREAQLKASQIMSDAFDTSDEKGAKKGKLSWLKYLILGGLLLKSGILGKIFNGVIKPLWTGLVYPWIQDKVVPWFKNTALPVIGKIGTTILDGAVELLPTALDKVVEYTPKIVGAVLPKIPSIVGALVTSLITHIPDLVSATIKALPSVVGNVFNALDNFFKHKDSSNDKNVGGKTTVSTSSFEDKDDDYVTGFTNEKGQTLTAKDVREGNYETIYNADGTEGVVDEDGNITFNDPSKKGSTYAATIATPVARAFIKGGVDPITKKGISLVNKLAKNKKSKIAKYAAKFVKVGTSPIQLAGDAGKYTRHAIGQKLTDAKWSNPANKTWTSNLTGKEYKWIDGKKYTKETWDQANKKINLKTAVDEDSMLGGIQKKISKVKTKAATAKTNISNKFTMFKRTNTGKKVSQALYKVKNSKVVTAAGNAKNKVKTVVTTAITKIKDFLTRFFTTSKVSRFVSRVLEKLKITDAANWLKTKVDNIATWLGKQVEKIVAKTGVESVEKAFKNLNIIATVAFAVTDFLTGMDQAEAMLGVTDTTVVEEFVCGLANALINAFFILAILLSPGEIAQKILKFFGVNIEDRQKEADEEYEQYKEDTGSTDTKYEYLSKKKSFTGKFKSTIGKGFSTIKSKLSTAYLTGKEGASNAFEKVKDFVLGKTKEDVKDTGDNPDVKATYNKYISKKNKIISPLSKEYWTNIESKDTGMLGGLKTIGNFTIRILLSPLALVGSFVSSIMNLANTFKNWVTSKLSGIKKLFTNPVEFVKDLVLGNSSDSTVSDTTGATGTTGDTSESPSLLQRVTNFITGNNDDKNNEENDKQQEETNNKKETEDKTDKDTKNTTTSSTTKSTTDSKKTTGTTAKKSTSDKNLHDQIFSGTIPKFGTGLYSKQIDPSISGIRFNTSGDHEYQTIGDSGCGPAAAVNVVESVFGKGGKAVVSAAKYALNHGYKERDGGTDPRFFTDYFNQHGLGSETTTNRSQIAENIYNGEPTVLMGDDPNGVSSSTPYGSTPHYVTVTGTDDNGRAIVQDPESNYDNQIYDMDDLLDKTSLGISAYGKHARFGRGGKFPVYNLSDTELKGLASVLAHEQPGMNGYLAEASLMANLTDIGGDQDATKAKLMYKVLKSGWFGKTRAQKRYNAMDAPANAVTAARIVFNEGKRTLPRYVNEHDCYSDIASLSNGKSKKDRNSYVPHETVVNQASSVGGGKWIFYSFPGTGTDPFGYISKEARQKWGDDHYDPSTLGGDSSDTAVAGTVSGSTTSSDSTTTSADSTSTAETTQTGGAIGELLKIFGSSLSGQAYNSVVGSNTTFSDSSSSSDSTSSSGGTVAGGDPGKLISVAKGEIGNAETPKGSNRTKYGKWYGMDGNAWCAMFVSWCANQAGIPTSVIPKYASCSDGYSRLKSMGAKEVSGSEARTGDILFVHNGSRYSHTGIVSAGDGTSVSTVEGNASDSVRAKTLKASDKSNHYLRPNYANAGSVTQATAGSIGTNYDVTTYANTRGGNKHKPLSKFGKGKPHVKYDESTIKKKTANPEDSATDYNPFTDKDTVIKDHKISDQVPSKYPKRRYNQFANVASKYTKNSTKVINRYHEINPKTKENTVYNDFAILKDNNNPHYTEYGLGKYGRGNQYEPAIWYFLKCKGFTDEAAAGVMGNLKQESQCNPEMIQGNGKGPAAGLCQWENYNKKSARWKSMSDYASSKGKKWTDITAQLEWMYLELTGKDKTCVSKMQAYGGIDGLKSCTSVEQACEIFEKCFERAGKPNMSNRYKYAREYYRLYKGTAGTPLPGVSPDSGVTVSGKTIGTMTGIMNKTGEADTSNTSLANTMSGADSLANSIKASKMGQVWDYLFGSTSSSDSSSTDTSNTNFSSSSSSSTLSGVGGDGAKLVQVAQGEIGTEESPAGSNHTKYSKWWYGNNTPAEWCGMFVSWCANQAGIPTSVVPKYSYTPDGYKALKQYEVSNAEARTGDLLFEYRPEKGRIGHTGIVESNDGKKVHTIEGNSSNKVQRLAKAYSSNYKYVRPQYANPTENAALSDEAKSVTTSYGSATGGNKNKPLSKYGKFRDIRGFGLGNKSKSKFDTVDGKDQKLDRDSDTTDTTLQQIPTSLIREARQARINSSRAKSIANQIPKRFGMGNTITSPNVDYTSVFESMVEVLTAIANNTDKLNLIAKFLSDKLGVEITEEDVSNATLNKETLRSQVKKALNNSKDTNINTITNDANNSSIMTIISAMNSIASD